MNAPLFFKRRNDRSAPASRHPLRGIDRASRSIIRAAASGSGQTCGAPAACRAAGSSVKRYARSARRPPGLATARFPPAIPSRPRLIANRVSNWAPFGPCALLTSGNPTGKDLRMTVRLILAAAAMTIGAGAIAAPPTTTPGGATPATPATPAQSATPASPADPSTGTSATPATPATAADPATAAEGAQSATESTDGAAAAQPNEKSKKHKKK